MPAATTQSPPVRAGRASRFDQYRSAMCCCSYLERSPVEFALKVDARDCEGWVYAVPVVNPPAKLGRSCQWQLCAQMRSLCRTIANPETCHSDVPMSAAGHTRPD